MITSLAARPESVTLPLMSDPDNVEALRRHFVTAALSDVQPDGPLADVWGDMAAVVASDDASAALRRVLLALQAQGHTGTSAAVDAGERATQAALLGSSMALRVQSVYANTADPAHIPCELPGWRVVLRGLQDYPAVARDAANAVRRNGQLWRPPLLGGQVADRIDALTWQAAQSRKDPLHGHPDAIRAREVDALSEVERDAYEQRQEYDTAWTREMAARVILGFEAVDDAIPPDVAPRTVDGPLYPVDAMLATWEAEVPGGIVQRRIPAHIVRGIWAECVNLSQQVYAAGKGPSLARAS